MLALESSGLHTENMVTYKGTVKNGRVELEAGANLPDGTDVNVEPIDDSEDPADRLADEAVSTGLTDLAEQHDHYAHGTPKRAD